MMERISGLAALSLMLAVPAMAQDAAPPPPVVETGAPPAPTPMPAPMPAAAPAGAMDAFGSVGQMVISADLPFQNEAPVLVIAHESNSMGGSATVVGIQPSLDYFVAPNISVGGEVGIAYTTLGGGASGSNTVLAVEVRAGYNLPLGDMLSLWPRVSIGYSHSSSSSGGMSSSGYSVPLDVSVPFLFHPGSHFFLGAGPMITTELVNKVEGVSVGKSTDYGVQGLIGGYFGS
jgi:hypothetical protein